MTGTVAVVAKQVPRRCQAKRCKKFGCRVDLTGAPPEHLLVDMDCKALKIPNQQKRCDYLFLGEEGNTTWVAPIELKSGRLNATEVVEQLEGGVRMVDTWLSSGISFRLVPVLALGRQIHRQDINTLLSGRIELRGDRIPIKMMRCGGALMKTLRAAPSVP